MRIAIAAVVTAAFVAMLARVSPVSACGGGCTAGWTPYTGISASITSPTTSNNGRGINAEVQFTCSATDLDRYQNADCSYNTPVSDGLTYTWTAQAGTFPYGNTGSTVTWKAPANHGSYWVKVTVNDDGSPTGTDDPAVSPTRTMEVIRLDKVRLYLYHYGTAYPYISSDAFKTRAVVWASCGTQGAYCDLVFDESLVWWFDPGIEGPLDDPDDQEPPDTTFFGDTVDDWPNNWPSLNINWTLFYHVASDPDGSHNRVFSYPAGQEQPYYPNTSAWGDDNRTYSSPGLHRLRATATMHSGTSWDQSVTSRDREFAFDIRPRYDITAAGTAQRNNYVEWLSANLNEPYEWGGEYFGGYDSNGNYAGGGDGYDGYGVDCSGLVSIAAYRHGADYNWPYWRQTTTGIASDTYSSAVSDGDFDEGDVLVKAGTHVLSCKQRDGGDPNVITIIHASGSADKVYEESSTISYWLGQGYGRRRLRPY